MSKIPASASSKLREADRQPPTFRLGDDGELLGAAELLEPTHNGIRLTAANGRERRWAAWAYGSILLQLGALLLSIAMSAISDSYKLLEGLPRIDAAWIALLMFSTLPIVFPIALYFYWLNRSDYIALHAAQAVSMLILACAAACPMYPISESIVTSITSAIYAPPTFPMLLAIVVLPVLLVIWPFLVLITLAIGMIQTARGKVFLLPILGRSLEDYLRNWYRYDTRDHVSSKKRRK